MKVARLIANVAIAPKPNMKESCNNDKQYYIYCYNLHLQCSLLHILVNKINLRAVVNIIIKM